ncbi:MAG: TPR end-of-group domain-containing protein, partial [Kiritimatiellia bacterium]
MRKILFLVALTVLPVLAEETPLSLWACPNVWPQHNQLRQQLIGAIRRGDIPGMESICRQALTVMPGDATWHYNLACALAYREQSDLALEELEQAIRFGFRDAAAIEKDSDLARISSLPRFKELVELARTLANQPVAGRPVPTPHYATMGGSVVLSETNLVFNFETGVYDALLKLSAPKTPLAEQAQAYSASKPDAPERPLLVGWLADGTAAGNAGDIYVNRDRGHSMLATGDFPQLTSLRFAASSRPFNVDVNHPNTFIGNATVFGNISRGITSGPFWRSMARATFTEPGNLAARMDLLYHANQFWVIPCVNDYGKPELGDVFPANAPFQLVSEGASWSDQPFLRAALAASAALPPPTKQSILRRKL